MSLIEKALKVPHSYNAPIVEDYESSLPVLSIHIDAFYNVEYTKQAVESVLNQTYPNVELILVDNGANNDIKEYLSSIYASQDNVALICFPENQFSWDDTEKSCAICYNVALYYANGKYISHLAYDDKISLDYAEKIISLFLENKNCLTAAPMPYSINSLGEIRSSGEASNQRDRYSNGFEIAIDHLKGKPRKLFAAPGEIFVIERKFLIKQGGYDRLLDISQVLKCVAFGISGYASDAKLFWRHHPEQLNKQAKRRGNIWYQYKIDSFSESGCQKLWLDTFGAEDNLLLSRYLNNSLETSVLNVLKENFFLLNYSVVLLNWKNILRECPLNLIIKAILVSVIEVILVPYRILRTYLSKNISLEFKDSIKLFIRTGKFS